MKSLNVLQSFVVCSTFLVLASSCDLFQPAQDKFAFRTGDYTVYENVALDTNGAPMPNTTTRSSRIVLRTGVSIGNQTDAALIVDSTFNTAGRLESTDTTYYRVANDEVFQYFGLGEVNRIGAALGGGSLAAGSVTGLEPKWVKTAELKNAAGTADFPTTEITATINVDLFGAVALVARFSGRNQGATDVAIGSTTYRAHRQNQTLTVTTSLPLVGNIQISTPTVIDFGIPSQNATPRTIIRSEQKAATVVIPILGPLTVPGLRSTMTSFRSGGAL